MGQDPVLRTHHTDSNGEQDQRTLQQGLHILWCTRQDRKGLKSVSSQSRPSMSSDVEAPWPARSTAERIDALDHTASDRQLFRSGAAVNQRSHCVYTLFPQAAHFLEQGWFCPPERDCESVSRFGCDSLCPIDLFEPLIG